MKLKSNRKPKSGKKIKTPPTAVDKELNADMHAIMAQWQESQRQEKEDLAAQTWPVWLLPEDFEKWYVGEQRYRQDMGMILLPSPPVDVIQKIIKK